MKSLSLIILAFVALTMVSCSSNDSSNNKNAYVGNAEELLPWVNNGNFKEVKMENHPFAFFVDSASEYSYGYKMKVANIKVKDFKKITVSCDGYLYQTPSNVQLVIDIKNEGNNLFWQGEHFDKTITEASKWGKVTFTVDKPKDLNPNCEILVYAWSQSREAALFDNLTVQFE